MRHEIRFWFLLFAVATFGRALAEPPPQPVGTASRTFEEVIAEAQSFDPMIQPEQDKQDSDKAAALYMEAVSLRPDNTDNAAIEYKVGLLLTQLRPQTAPERTKDGLAVFEAITKKYPKEDLFVAKAAFAAGEVYWKSYRTKAEVSATAIQEIKEFEPWFQTKDEATDGTADLQLAVESLHLSLDSYATRGKKEGIESLAQARSLFGGESSIMEAAVKQYVQFDCDLFRDDPLEVLAEVAKEFSNTPISEIALRELEWRKAHPLPLPMLIPAPRNAPELLKKRVPTLVISFRGNT